MKNTIYIIGNGGHASVVAQAVKLSGSHPVMITTSDLNVMGRVSTISERQFFSSPPTERSWGLICGVGSIGSMLARRALLEKYAVFTDRFVNVIHPKAIVDDTVTLGHGIFISAGAVIQVDAKIGHHSIVNTSTVVEHGAVVGENVHLATGSRLLGAAVIENDVLIGAGSIVLQEVQVGKQVIVGAGAVCIKNIPKESGTWMGIPALRHQRSSKP